MTNDTIGSFQLHNRGGPYNSKISCFYGNSLTNIKTRGGNSKTVMEGGQTTVSCGELDVPNKNYVIFHLNVQAGKDKDAKEIFIYDKDSKLIALYECSGAVDTAKLNYRGIITPP